MGRIQLPLHEDEKLLPISGAGAEQKSKSKLRVIALWSLVGLAGLVGLDLGSPSSLIREVLFKHPHHSHHHHAGSHSFCPAQVEPLYPKLAFEIPESYANESASRLSQAVRIPTVSFDDNGSPEDDPRWQVFYQFHYWLQDTFPQVFKHPNVTITPINRLALLTEIKGSDESLKPLMLTSHYDVVPVPNATLSRWTHPPFDGVFDGTFVWGRGAGDDKSLLVAQYEALSMLLSTGWIPRRSIILGHGNDEEEVSARQGAGHLAPYLEEKYGRDSMLMIVDEGSSAIRMFDTAFATPATGEKGYLDVRVTVGTKGGHSSVPPSHTGIGIMSQIINAVEEKSYQPGFEGPTDPIFQFAMCASEHSNAPKDWKKAVRKRDWSGLAKKFAAISPAARAVVSTTQAVDVIQGGVKVNALPEEVVATINHRISFAHSVDYVKKHITHVVAPIAKKHNLRLSAFNSTISSGSGLGDSYVQLEVQGIPLEPAPKTPTSGAVWELFSGSIRAVHKDEKNGDMPYVVSPFASTGNTDTKVYWNLSKNIFRYMGSPVPEYESHAHTVDEKTSLKDHLAIVQWIFTLVQNTDSFSE